MHDAPDDEPLRQLIFACNSAIDASLDKLPDEIRIVHECNRAAYIAPDPSPEGFRAEVGKRPPDFLDLDRVIFLGHGDLPDRQGR